MLAADGRYVFKMCVCVCVVCVCVCGVCVCLCVCVCVCVCSVCVCGVCVVCACVCHVRMRNKLLTRIKIGAVCRLITVTRAFSIECVSNQLINARIKRVSALQYNTRDNLYIIF